MNGLNYGGPPVVEPATDVYTINVSSVLAFRRCRYRWICAWVLNRVPHVVPALEFGKLLHTVLEDVNLGRSTMAQAMDALAVRPEALIDESAVMELLKYREHLEAWTDRYPFEVPVLEAEEPFTIVSPFDASIAFKGRPDRFGLLWDNVVHVQNRSLHSGKNFLLYTRLARRHDHELLYGWYAANVKYPQHPYGGTVFNLLRKIAPRDRKKQLRPLVEIMWQGLVPYAPEEQVAGVWRLTEWAREMRECEERFRATGEFPLPNEDANGGFFGNSEDPYFKVLLGETTLENDRLFVDREDTYAERLP
jgi:hypothetical protein